MPFSFSRLFLGKKATIIDEDSLPCQPREIVPVAVDADPVTSKTKFGFTKIGRALKHKFHLNTTHAVPAGHGPLVVVADEPFSRFSRCLQSPATPLQSLPHIPDVSSTLRRDFRNATRFALLAAAEEANSLSSSNDIYISTPCRKQRTQSSSVLGGSELPRPETPLDFESLRPQHQESESDGLASLDRSFLITPIDTPMIWDDEEISTYSSEYNEIASVLPLGFGEDHPQVSPPFIGLAAIQTAFPSSAHNWYLQQYLQSNANWSLPVIPDSDPASSPYNSFPELPKLDLGSRKSLPASSVYSSFTPPYNVNNRNTTHTNLSPTSSQLTTYSPVKLGAQAELLTGTVEQSPPADESAREAQLYDTVKLSLDETDEVRSGDDCVSASEVYFDSTESEEHVTALKTPTRLRESLLEPIPNQFVNDSIGESLPNTSENDFEHLATPNTETDDDIPNMVTSTRVFSTDTVLIRRPQENTGHFRHSSLVLRQLAQHAPESILQAGPERLRRLVAVGPSRFIADFDLFASKQQHGCVHSVSAKDNYTAVPADDSREIFATDPGRVISSEPSSSVPEPFRFPFVPVSYETISAEPPTLTCPAKCSSSSVASSHSKHVAFAKARRIITHGGTATEEDEATFKQGGDAANLLSKFEDLKDGWHHDDQDLIGIEEHVADYKVQRADRNRTKATKHALTCLQICLTQANTRLMQIKPLEDALELRHKSHIDAVEQVTKLSQEVAELKAREAAGKVVFDQMMSQKLIELASKDKELETLRELCDNEPVTKELAGLHEALHESRDNKNEYLQHAEESFNLLKRADDRQAQAEQETQTARIAETFAEMSRQSAEEYRDNLKERIVELEAERDQAYEARDDALAEVEQRQQAQIARDSGLAKPVPSTTPMGTPRGYLERHDYALAEATEEEARESAVEDEEEPDNVTEGIAEEIEDWDDSQIL